MLIITQYNIFSWHKPLYFVALHPPVFLEFLHNGYFIALIASIFILKPKNYRTFFSNPMVFTHMPKPIEFEI